MKDTDNLLIVQRALEIAKNELTYSLYPKPFKQEYCFLSNVLSHGLRAEEEQFARAFQEAVGHYKSNLERTKEYGWFHSPERLIWLNTYINQVRYIIYGDRYEHKLVFREELGKDAYRDLINQIDCTALMSEEERKAHMTKCNAMASEIIQEILAREKKDEE